MKKIKLNYKYFLPDSDEQYCIVREDRNSYYIVDNQIHDLLLILSERGEFHPIYEVHKDFCTQTAERSLIKFLKKRGIKI